MAFWMRETIDMIKCSSSFFSVGVVALLVAPVFGQIEIAEELIVDLNASHASAGTATWTNEAGVFPEDNFKVIMGTPTVGDVDGTTAVTFDGGSVYQMDTETPPTLTGVDPSRSIEVWVYNPTIDGEENMVAWGHRGEPCGSSMGFNFAGLAVTHWCHDLGWDPAPPAAAWTHLAYSLDGSTLSIYENGVIKNSRGFNPGLLVTHEPSRITIAAQLENDGMTPASANFRGTLSIAQVRVHGGALDAAQVLNNFNEEVGNYNVPNTAPTFLTVPVDTSIEKNSIVEYSEEVRIGGFPVGSLEIIEPAEATLVEIFPRRQRIVYPVPDPQPDSVDFTVRVTNGMGDPVERSWTISFVGLDPNNPIQVAGELFVDLRGDGFDDAAGVWENEGTLDDFDITYGFPVNATVGGAQGVSFDGNSAVQGEFAPPGLAGSSGRTVEVWAYNPEAVAPEETLVSWGRRGAPALSNESFLYSLAALVHWDVDLGWGTVPAYGQWHHLVYTYDEKTGLSKVYSDGAQVNQRGPDTLVTHAGRITLGSQLCSPISPGCQPEDIEGESLAHGNHKYSGLISQVRIHDGVLLDFQIAHNHNKERPNYLTVTEPADIPNAPTADTIFLDTDPYVSHLSIVGLPAPLVEVLSPPGASVAANGTLTAPVPDPANPGSFEVSIRVSNEAPGLVEKLVNWTVSVRGPPNPGDPLETAGEVFVNVDAGHATAGEASWTNTGTLGDLIEVGDVVKTTVFGGDAVAFNLESSGNAYQTPEDAPAGLVGKIPTRTIEVWALNPSIDAEEGMVAWGRRSDPCGSKMSFNFANLAVTHWCHDLGWGAAAPTTNAWHHLVYTHDGAATRVYIDGVEVNNRTDLLDLQINTDSGTPIVLGSQVNGNGTLDGGFQLSGYLSRVRVMDGVLRAEQILHNFNEEKGDFEAGPPQFRDPMGDQTAFNDRTYRRRVVVFSQLPTDAAFAGSTPPGSTLRVLSSDGGGAAGVDSVNLQPGENVEVVVPIPDPVPESFTVDLNLSNANGQVGSGWVVTLVPPPTRPPSNQIEVAEELFVHLDVADPSSGTDSWANLGTLEDFNKVGGPFIDIHSGFAGVAFNRFVAEDAYQSEDQAPAGLVGPDPTRSIECWAFNEGIGSEEGMVAWGGRSAPSGSNVSFNYGSSDGFGAVTHWDAPDMPWGLSPADIPAAGEWHHLVYTLDGTTARVYSDGALINEKIVGGQINTDTPSKITLGAQNLGDGMTPDFTGNHGTLSLAIVRVHDGVLDDDQILSNYELELPHFTETESPQVIFRRGDCDQSGKVDFNDAIFHLRFLFLGENEEIVNSCKDACDSDDSGVDDFTDDINTLKVLFLGQGDIPAPGPMPDESHPCGVDPTNEDNPATPDILEELTCEAYDPLARDPQNGLPCP